MIPVSRPHLPSRQNLERYLNRVYETHWLSNRGPLHAELTTRLATFLDVNPDNLVLVANGTLALQIAIKSLELEGQIITSPFSFVASTSAAVWQGLEPKFCDIDEKTWNLSTSQAQKLDTTSANALLPVHVFGQACNTDAIDQFARSRNLQVIYDASHCFGVKYQNRSILEFGNISTLSFHATKLFHTVEGGAIYTNDTHLAKKIRRMSQFGTNDQGVIVDVGINAKLSEVHAAMGLAVLDEMDEILAERETIWKTYDAMISSCFGRQKRDNATEGNHSYFPILCDDEATLEKLQHKLKDKGVDTRRYFYPSLINLPYLGDTQHCPISESISRRVLCLPLYTGLRQQEQIIDTVNAMAAQS